MPIARAAQLACGLIAILIATAEPAAAEPETLQVAAGQMWIRIAGAIEREAAAAPPGEDRALAEQWARRIRDRARLRAVR